MKPVFCIIMFVLSLNYTFAQEAVNYQLIPLEWNNFSIVSNNKNYTAKVAVANRCEIGYIMDKNKVTIELETSLKIDKKTSTVSRKFINSASLVEKNELLDHEKGHVLISVIFQYKLVEEFNKIIFTKNYKTEIRNLVQKITEDKERTNQLYDLETNHHLNKEAQIKWNTYLFEQLIKVNGDKRIEWEIKVERRVTI